MWAALAAVAGQALSSSKPAPASSALGGNAFNGQDINLGWQGGIPSWNRTQGGDGAPPEVVAFRPDSYVMGLTGLSTQTNVAAGNGIAVNQPTAVLNTAPFQALNNPTSLLLIGAIVLAAVWIAK